MGNALKELWIRAGWDEPVFSYDDVHRWPAETLDQFARIGLLRETSQAESVMCDNCFEAHWAEVIWTPSVHSPSGVIPIIGCPVEGACVVDPERLRQWVIDLNALSTLVADSLDLSGVIEPLPGGRLWLLGRRRLSGRFRDFFFVIGAAGSAGTVIAGSPRITTSPAPVILVPTRSHLPEPWRSPGMPVFYLQEVAAFGEGGLALDLPYIEDALPRDLPTPQESTGQKPAAADGGNIFRREQDFWVITFQGKAVRLRHIVGFDYLAALLRQPGAEVEALSLVGRAEPEVEAVVASPGLEVADERALREVRTVLDTRRSELAAIPTNDWPTRGRLQEEIAKLEAYLSQAAARNGRARKIAGSAQRARTAVTNAVVRAIQNIEREHKDLGAHLHSSVRTGTTLLYLPPEPVDWQF